jgi:hypothetical protein
MISALLTAVIPALILPWVLIPLRAPALFAILPAAPLMIVYARAIAAGRADAAVAAALAWAASVTVATVAAAALMPEAASASIWLAGGYRNEMLRWIATGQGAEGSIAIFLPRVLLEYALVLVLSAASAGAAGLFLGSLLLGFMNAYVGWVIAHGDPASAPLATALVAWPPWSVLRVVSFILAGTAGALWGYPRLFRRGSPRTPVRRLLAASGAFLLGDILLKWWLAPIWRDWLRAILGASAGLEAGGTG